MTICFKFPRWMWSRLDNVHSHHNLWHAVNCIMTPVKRTISIRKRSLTLFPSWAFIVLSHFTSFHQPQSHYCIISRVTFIIFANKAKQWVRIGNRDRSQFWNRTLPPVQLSCHPAFSMACIISTVPVVFGHSSSSIIVLRWQSCGDCGWSFRVRVWG